MKEYSFEVTKTDAGSRIDKWLTHKMGLPRGRIKSLLDAGRVQVNRRRVLIAGWELEEHDHVMVRVPKEVPQEKPAQKPAQAPRREKPPEPQKEKVRVSALRNIGKPTLLYQSLSKKERAPKKDKRSSRKKRDKRGGGRAEDREGFLKVYHHDKHLLVVEKPAGLLTIPQKGSDHPHLLGRIKAFLRRKYAKGKHSFVKPLHRLDSETSGVMVFALSKDGERLSKQFRNHTINRRYIAIVHGAVEREQGSIKADLEKGSFGEGRKVRVAKETAGKQARTDFRVKERYAKASLLDIIVASGRTHQIRVHLAHESHPVIGDKIYHDERQKQIPFPRHALHAHALGFRHPVTGNRMSFNSPLPADMKQLVDDLRGN